MRTGRLALLLLLACGPGLGCRFDTLGPRLQPPGGDAQADGLALRDGGADGLAPLDLRAEAGAQEGGVTDGRADARADASPSVLPSGVLVFGDNTPATAVRRWRSDLLSWQIPPASPSSGLDLRWAQIRHHAAGEVVALKGVLLGEPRTEIWQLVGGTWVERPALRQEPPDDSLAAIGDVALGREALSGDLLLVVGAASKAPRFASYTGGQWSDLARLPSAVKDGDDVWWVELVARPGSDELMLLYSDKANDLYGVRWDGGAWDGASFLELTNDLFKNDTTGVVANRAFDGAYEGSTAHFIAVWGREGKDGIQHARWDGGAWTKTTEIEFYPGRTAFVDVAPDPRPGSSLVAGVFIDTGGTERLAAGVWDGAQWSVLAEVDSQILDTNDEGRGDAMAAVGWVGNTAVALYPDEGGALRWISCSDGATDWTLHNALTVSGMASLESVIMRSQTSPRAGVVALLSDSSRQLFGLFYDGASWRRLTVPALTSRLSSSESVPFDVDLY